MKTPGQRIKEERLSLDWSQQKLADEISRIKGEKISRAAVAQWENGDSKTQKPENLFAAASAMGLCAQWVLNASGEKYLANVPPLKKLTTIDLLRAAHDPSVDDLSDFIDEENTGSIKKALSKTGINDLREDGRDVYEIGQGRLVPVIGSGNGGHLPERVWDDQGYPVGDSDEFSEVATSDEHAFIVRVRGDSMYPKYTPGEYALVEPGAVPDVGDDVLVRLVTGETLIKTLAARSSDGVRLSSYNTSEVKFYAHNEVSWLYWVPFPIPSKKIKARI